MSSGLRVLSSLEANTYLQRGKSLTIYLVNFKFQDFPLTQEVKECLLRWCVGLSSRKHMRELGKEGKQVLLSKEMIIKKVRTQVVIN